MEAGVSPCPVWGGESGERGPMLRRGSSQNSEADSVSYDELDKKLHNLTWHLHAIRRTCAGSQRIYLGSLREQGRKLLGEVKKLEDLDLSASASAPFGKFLPKSMHLKKLKEAHTASHVGEHSSHGK